MKRFLALAMCFLAASLFVCNATLKTKAPCSDGMVLQQNSNPVVWGFADAQASVTVKTSWDGKTYSTKAGDDGLWRVNVNTLAASYYHHTITVKSKGESMTINDVLIGEVWFASGQSNMEMPMAGWGIVKDANEYITATPAPDKIRMFFGHQRQSYEVRNDTEGIWLKACPEQISRMSATAFFFARKLNMVLDVPVAVVIECFGGSMVESWLPKEKVESYGWRTDKEYVESINRMNRPYLMYNGMLHPVAGYKVRGVIWYQGCSNVGRPADEYKSHMIDLINLIRDEWQDNSLPFYSVQIAPFDYGGSNSPEIRQAQLDIRDVVDNYCVAGSVDTVDPWEPWQIHPTNKKPIGERLAYLALNRDYGYSGVRCYCPEANKVEKGDSKYSLKVHVKNAELYFNQEADCENFEVAGEDGVWHPATSVEIPFMEDMWIHVKSTSVPHPVAVRYCWSDWHVGKLVNNYGLPLLPFNLRVL